MAIAGDCPVVGGGGYTGFEHNLYRIEIADTAPGAPARFKWSQWNGGLAGRGRFDSTTDPDRVIIDAGRAAIVNSGLTEFYLEALQYDELDRRLGRRLRHDRHAQHRPRSRADGAGELRHAAVDHRLGVLPAVERHRRHLGVHQRR